MRIQLIILLLLVTSVAFANPLVLLSGSPPSAVVTFPINENFNSGTKPTGWTEVSSTMTWNYTPALVDTYSLYSPGGATTRRTTSPTFTAGSDIYAATMLGVPSNPGVEMTYFSINTTDAFTQLCKVSINTSGIFKVVSSGGSAGVSAINGVSSAHYILLHYVAGSGSNARCDLYATTTAPTSSGDWGSPIASSTNGTTTATADRLFFGTSGDVTTPSARWNRVKGGNSTIPTY